MTNALNQIIDLTKQQRFQTQRIQVSAVGLLTSFSNKSTVCRLMQLFE